MKKKKVSAEDFNNFKFTSKNIDDLFEMATKNHIDYMRKDGEDENVIELLERVFKERFYLSIKKIDELSESPIEKEVGKSLICGLYANSPAACVVAPSRPIDEIKIKETEGIDKDLMDEFLNLFYMTDFWLMPNMWLNDKIRADFVILRAKDKKIFIIECDSFQYHGNKEGFIKDKKREREIVKLGYPILRFSGSEIVKNSIKVAREIFDFITNFELEKTT